MSDPNYNDTTLILNAGGTDGDTVIVDSSPDARVAGYNATVEYDDAITIGGLSSIKWIDGRLDYTTLALQTTFTVEGYFIWNGGASEYILTNRGALAGQEWIVFPSGGNLVLWVDGATRLTHVTFTSGVEYHIAVTGDGSDLRMWVNGVQAGAQYAIATQEVGFWIGGNSISGNRFAGNAAGIRVTNGVNRYTAPFTPPALPLPESAPVPTIDTQPQPQTVTEGNNAVYTVAATTSGGTLLYQWYETTAGILGVETANTLTITTVLGDNGNGYYVIVTDDNGATQSDTAALTVNAVIPPPSGSSTIFDDSKGFPSEEYENAIDRITFMMQELEGSLCDCRYIDPVTGLPPVVTCVALLSSTGIFNINGEPPPDPVFGETVSLSVGVSGTGPYTYQWNVGGVPVVGATSLAFDIVITGNLSITVDVGNDCSDIVVGPYLIQFCEGYDCEALYRAASVSAEAYWPMTDPMVNPGGTRFFHAGEPYGPYTDGGDKQLFLSLGDVGTTPSRTIAFADFNYCEPVPTGSYKHYYSEWAVTNGWAIYYVQGSPAVWPANGGYTVHHVFALPSDLLQLEGEVDIRMYKLEVASTQVKIIPRVAFDLDATNVFIRLTIPGNTATTTPVAHGFDITKPYLVTSTMATTGAIVDGDFHMNYQVSVICSQPGAADIVMNLTDSDIQGSGGGGPFTSFTEGDGFVQFGRGGNDTYWLGLGVNGVHAQILEGLAQNYEDYECP